jgi:2-polyprenyl-3-methyl-5-hydroxy-6-metoxy-1,4-benzoquinol methylase
MENNKNYNQQITEEGLFWGEFEQNANKFGAPWWCDLRKATKLSKVICGWMYDPKIEEILRGFYKDKLIKTASSRKGRALDIGCGSGWLSLELARNGSEVDAIDISNKRIEIAKEYLKKNNFLKDFGSIHYQVKDINKINLEKNKYESVVCWDTLHHIPNIERVIKKICNSLKINGYFIIYDHIGLQKRNKLLIKIMRLPFITLYKMREMIVKTNTKDNKKDKGSPFEDITGEEMIESIKKYFKVISIETELCFLAALVNNLINLPDIIKYPILHILKFIDDILIKIRILRGEYVFIIAKKI